MENNAENVHQKLVPDPFFYFGQQPKTVIVCKKFLLKIRYFESGLSKTLKKYTFIFSFEPSPF